MITDKIDISGLNRHELAELRDEVDFELALHDAEMRAFYGVGILPADDDIWCPVCDDYDVEGMADAIREAHDTLMNNDKGLEERIEAAASTLEDAL